MSKLKKVYLFGRLSKSDACTRTAESVRCFVEDALDDALEALRMDSAISVMWSFVERACSDTIEPVYKDNKKKSDLCQWLPIVDTGLTVGSNVL